LRELFLIAMWKRVSYAAAALLACASLALAQRAALFLTDGTQMNVREFEVGEERVRYFSLDRNQWEEVPLQIVDLARTNEHNRRVQSAAAVREEETRRERVAERRARTELHSVPLEDGVYYLKGKEPVPVEQAFWELGKSTKRIFFNIISPVPVIPGKRTLSIEGLTAKIVTTDPKPIFYLRLDSFSRFGIARIVPERGKNRRVVQQIMTVSVADEQFEEQDEVEVFRQQLAPLVYKVWPVEPLPAGEYAILDFNPGETDLRVWDFSHRPDAAP